MLGILSTRVQRKMEKMLEWTTLKCRTRKSLKDGIALAMRKNMNIFGDKNAKGYFFLI